MAKRGVVKARSLSDNPFVGSRDLLSDTKPVQVLLICLFGLFYA